MQLTRKEVLNFQMRIFTWWAKNKRDLPWRYTNDPYKIVISELMLQQTQVSRVITKYIEFIDKFPTVYDLSLAPVAEVITMWKGLGYNRRALYLKKMADIITHIYKGSFPNQEKELRKLPGLGKYTARAILVFAFKKDIAMIDTNIRQIIIHTFCDGIIQKESIIQDIADQLVPKGKSWEWHQALMDYGSSTTFPALPKKKKDKFIPFKQTNRFFRGRMVDILRQGQLNEQKLIELFTKQYTRTPEFVTGIINALVADGLIERSKTGIISLPL